MMKHSVRVDYVVDITKEYHNLLQTCEDSNTQTYLWDGNVAGMFDEKSGIESYYLQDEIGSPVRLTDEEGNLRESYGYDEFGQDLYDNQGAVQPFGYTGYQYDSVAGTYFAQAREYRAGEGRFGGEDLIKGSTDMPFTLNPYGYCFGNPMILVDLDGAWPKIPSLSDIGNGIKTVAKVGAVAVTTVVVVTAVVVTGGTAGAIIAGAVMGAGFEIAEQAIEIKKRGKNPFIISNYKPGEIVLGAVTGVALAGVAVGAAVAGEAVGTGVVATVTELTTVTLGSAAVGAVSAGIEAKMENPNISRNELKHEIMSGSIFGAIGGVIGFAVGRIVTNSSWYKKLVKKIFDARSRSSAFLGWNWNSNLYEKRMINLAKFKSLMRTRDRFKFCVNIKN